MGFFSRLFVKQSMGAPFKYKCARCGQRLHNGTGGTISGGIEVLEHMNKKLEYCTVCKEIYCKECCYQAGRRKGVNEFLCPNCGRDIS